MTPTTLYAIFCLLGGVLNAYFAYKLLVISIPESHMGYVYWFLAQLMLIYSEIYWKNKEASLIYGFCKGLLR